MPDSRPYPRPRSPWAMAMRWHDLLFAHWALEESHLRNVVPPALELDTFDGSAWLGVVPFRMSGVRARCTPPIPTLSAFPELNVRTYVRVNDRPGVYFFSLDAECPIAVATARRTFSLNYLNARMSCERAGDRVSYVSERAHIGAPPGSLSCTYGPIEPPVRARPGSLEHWLTERYCLYAVRANGTILRGEIDHMPWPLRAARWELALLDMTRLLAIELTAPPASLLFADRLDVRAWLPVRVARERAR